jgi:hypothetical protein
MPGETAFSRPFFKPFFMSFYRDLFIGFGGSLGDRKIVLDLWVDGVFLEVFTLSPFSSSYFFLRIL